MNKFFLLRIRLVGLNFLKVYKKLKDNGIEISNIYKKSYNTIFFDMSGFKLKKLYTILGPSCYEIAVEKQYTFFTILKYIKQRLGVICGILMFLVLLTFSSFFVWNVKIYGLDRIEQKSVVEVLSKHGIKSGSFLGEINSNEIEEELMNELPEISLVSVIKKGSTVIVNIKEKIYVEEMDETKNCDIIANYSGMITSLNVVQGTALFEVGDIVKIGEVLVGGYYYDLSNHKIECKANAEVTIKTWYFQTELFYKKLTVKERTGNKTTSTKLNLFNQDLMVKNTSHNYDSCDTIVTEKYLFKNNILPIKIITTTYYETKDVVIEQNFNEQRDEFVEGIKQEARKKVPLNLTVEREFEVVEEMENYFVVSAYCEVIVQN